MNWAFWQSGKGEGRRANAEARPDKAARASDFERADEAAALRTQARRRLIGAAVLLLAVVAVIPLVLDPLPRPVPDSIPIEVRGDKAALSPKVPLPLPDPAALQGAPPPDAASEAAAPSAAGTNALPGGFDANAGEAKAAGGSAAERKRADANGTDGGAAAAGAATVKAATDPGNTRPDLKAVPKSDASAAVKSAARSEARFAVQTAAPRNEQAARDLMAKLKSAGLPAYVERTEAADGPRWRVRVGPYPTRADAERARSRLRELGQSADLVAL